MPRAASKHLLTTSTDSHPVDRPGLLSVVIEDAVQLGDGASGGGDVGPIGPLRSIVW
jgi:hypothetical protein